MHDVNTLVALVKALILWGVTLISYELRLNSLQIYSTDILLNIWFQRSYDLIKYKKINVVLKLN